MEAPLEGVRILDLTQVQAGPSCTQLLAWLGAQVIKVEEPGVGDRTRRERGHRPDADSFYFMVFNANKRSLTLNLKSEEGRDIFLRLVALSDVVVENFGPGRMEAFGLDYARLKEANPTIVYASIKGFGSWGPYAKRKSFEQVAQAMSGAMSSNGHPDGPPTFISAGVADSGAGLHCAIGILAALRARDRTGQPQRVEVSMQEAAVNLTRIRIFETLATGQPYRRAGNTMWDGPSMVYPCAPGGPDDYVAIYIGGEAWDSLLALIGRPDLIGDPRYATEEGRRQHRLEVEEMISRWTSTRTKWEVMETLNELGIPCGAVLDTREVLEDPHLRAREMVLELEDPHRGRYTALGSPIKMDGYKPTVEPPPLLGEHTQEVLMDLLGMDGERIEELRRRGVV